MPSSEHKLRWLTRANVPLRVRGWDRAKIEAEGNEWPAELSSWVDTLLAGENIRFPGGLGTTGVGLLFAGGPGLGKTTYAIATLHEIVKKLPNDDEEARKVLGAKSDVYGPHLRLGYYTTWPEFLTLKKSAFNDNDEERARKHQFIEGLHGRAREDEDNVRILIVDDLGKEYGSSYDNSSFDELLRSRYDKALPTIVTTNVAVNKWSAMYGEAMGSFAHEAFEHVELSTKDLRLK